MQPGELPLGYGALVVMAVYLALMLGLGWLGRIRRKDH